MNPDILIQAQDTPEAIEATAQALRDHIAADIARVDRTFPTDTEEDA